MTALFRIVGLWRGQAIWLAVGTLVSLAALATLLGLMAGAASLALGAGGLIGLRALGVGRVVLRYTERLLTHSALFRALAALRVWFFRGLAARGAGGMGFRDAGDLVARMVNDIAALDAIYLRLLLPLAGCAVLLPALLVLLAPVHWWLAVSVGALFALAAFVVPAIAAGQSLHAGRAITATGAALRVACLDAASGLREIRACAAEDRFIDRIAAAETDLIAAERARAAQAARAQAIAVLIAQLGLLLTLLAAGRHPALIFVAAAAFELAGAMPRAGVLAGTAAAAAARVLDAADGPIAHPDPTHPVTMPRGSSLRFEAIQFAWQPDRPKLFDSLSIDIPHGMFVAILGPSGHGKSTLAALALKVVVPQAGRITIDGTDIASLASADLRARIAWLGQATHLFDDTVRHNILLGRPTATDAEIWAALDAAQIGAFIRTLPSQLDSQIGENGKNLSGGQGRRLALARALISPAQILLLDEPCAGLDAQTERQFFTTLNQVAKGRTVILIAHRLIGTERPDRIWRLSAGHAIAAAR